MLRTRQEEILETRLEGLRRSLTTTDRVLSGRDVILTFSREDDADYPAHSAGDRITIELSKIPNLGTNSALVEILGLNYHELAHVRYGVQHRQLVNKIPSQQLHRRFMEAYQVIEEARIETLLAAKYAKMKKYFAYPVIKYFVKEQSAWPTAFLFTYGRRYLPLKIRETFRDIFNRKYGGASEFAEVIDKYRVIAYTSADRIRTGANLINQFAELLQKYSVPILSNHNSVGEDTSDDQNHKNTTKLVSDSQTEEDSENAKQQTEEQDEKEKEGEDGSGFKDQEEEEESEDGEPESSSGETDSGDDESDQSGEGSESEDSGSGEDSEGSGEAELDSDVSSGDESEADLGGMEGSSNNHQDDEAEGKPGSRSGSNAPSPTLRSRHVPTRKELKEQKEELLGEMSEALDIVMEDQDVQEDVDNLNAAMEDESGLSSSLKRHDKSNDEDLQPITEQMLREADQLKDMLRQIWAQMEPGWMYGLSEGNRIDMQRASQAQTADDYDSIYVDWAEGQQENSGLEVVILADESYSMCGDIPLQPGETRFNRTKKSTVVSRQVWELMYALQEVEAHVTVLSFDSESRTMYDREDRVTTKGYVHLDPRGTTNPTYALVEAKRIFTSSEMPNKLLISISDGDWDPWANRNCPTILDQMDGVTKVAAVIDTDGENYKFAMADKFNVVRRTNGPIFGVMADAVTKIVEGNINA